MNNLARPISVTELNTNRPKKFPESPVPLSSRFCNRACKCSSCSGEVLALSTDCFVSGRCSVCGQRYLDTDFEKWFVPGNILLDCLGPFLDRTGVIWRPRWLTAFPGAVSLSIETAFAYCPGFLNWYKWATSEIDTQSICRLRSSINRSRRKEDVSAWVAVLEIAPGVPIGARFFLEDGREYTAAFTSQCRQPLYGLTRTQGVIGQFLKLHPDLYSYAPSWEDLPGSFRDDLTGAGVDRAVFVRSPSR